MKKRYFRIFMIFSVASLFALFVRLFVIEDFRIISDSMYPGLLTGDLVFISKFNFSINLPFTSYELVKFRSPLRSEVVAFVLPGVKGKTFIKRVVAIAGDTVKVKDGILTINGIPATYKLFGPDEKDRFGGTSAKEKDLVWEDIGAEKIYTINRLESSESDYGPIDIPENHFFVLGDNRGDSVDSRTWGPIPCSCLKGRVFAVWLSLDSLGTIRKDRIAQKVD